MESFESLVKSNYNAEVHRSIALFITYTFHTPAPSSSRTPRPLTPHSRSSTPGMRRRPTIETAGSNTPNTSRYFTKKQLGIRILEMYTRLLCTPGNLGNIRKFAKTVTNKVIRAWVTGEEGHYANDWDSGFSISSGKTTQRSWCTAA